MSKPTKEELYAEAHELTVDIYKNITVDLLDEGFDLAQEIRHAAFSASLALSPELQREDPVDDACGSSARLQCLLLIARDLSYFPKADIAGFLDRSEKINARLQKLRSRRKDSSP